MCALSRAFSARCWRCGGASDTLRARLVRGVRSTPHRDSLHRSSSLFHSRVALLESCPRIPGPRVTHLERRSSRTSGPSMCHRAAESDFDSGVREPAVKHASARSKHEVRSDSSSQRPRMQRGPFGKRAQPNRVDATQYFVDSVQPTSGSGPAKRERAAIELNSLNSTTW